MNRCRLFAVAFLQDSLVRFEEWDGEIRGSALKVQQLLEHMLMLMLW